MEGPFLKAGFDHPCKQTCSGWEQGRERGIAEGRRLERERIVGMLRNKKIYAMGGTVECVDDNAAWYAEWIENEGAK